MDSLYLRAACGEKTERPPIWIMRQAGRYLPEYRRLRQQHSFTTLVHTPELAAEVTLLPFKRFPFDAAILFSDILTITEPFGYVMQFSEGGGMELKAPEKEIRLSIHDTLHHVPKTIRLLKPRLAVPLIGFCGGPYTVCKYMQQMNTAWLDTITEASIAYLTLQIEAGIDAIQIFDSWAGFLKPAEFRTLVLPYLKRLVEAMRPFNIPVTLFCRGSTRYLAELIALQPTAIACDWELEMAAIRRQVPASMAVQGNLNPDLLSGPLELLQKETDALLQAMEGSSGYIFNLGHGILPDARLENVEWLVSRLSVEKS